MALLAKASVTHGSPTSEPSGLTPMHLVRACMTQMDFRIPVEGSVRPGARPLQVAGPDDAAAWIGRPSDESVTSFIDQETLERRRG